VGILIWRELVPMLSPDFDDDPGKCICRRKVSPLELQLGFDGGGNESMQPKSTALTLQWDAAKLFAYRACP
jgi:hypothetical protein